MCGATMQAPIESLLESFSEGAAAIGPDARIIEVNSYLAKRIGPSVGKTCYEGLAGLDEPCPFCPLEDLVKGLAGPEVEGIQVRHDTKCSIKARFVQQSENGFILETVCDLSGQELLKHSPEDSRVELPGVSDKLASLLNISRILHCKTPFEEKMKKALDQVTASMDDPMNSAAWLEVDNIVYGSPPEEFHGEVRQYEISVEGVSRGFIHADHGMKEIRPEEKHFLQEAAELIGSRLEILDLENKLKVSEERFKKPGESLTGEVQKRIAALSAETSYLKAILRHSEDMIITTDLESRIVVFNPGAETLLGYRADEVRGKAVSELWMDAAERKNILDEVTASGGVRNYETRLKTKRGGIVEISLTLSLLKDRQGKVLGTVGISKDIGREKAIRTELEQVNQNFREAIHFINHETKNSLIVMSGFLRRLLDNESDQRRKEHLQIIYHQSQFLEAMSRDFLVMAELEHGEFTIRKQLIKNLYEEVILPAITGLRERYPDSFESYDTSMGGVGAIELQGDPALLEIVYRNLFGNALKYSYPGGKLAYGFVDQGDSFLFNVWNTGPGVASDLVERIFDKFYRVHDASTKGKRGTGLGLYNVRKIIEAHGGRIWCETKPGEWINFLFVLPKE
jgi:PAS domain S-box-containing protein